MSDLLPNKSRITTFLIILSIILSTITFIQLSYIIYNYIYKTNIHSIYLCECHPKDYAFLYLAHTMGSVLYVAYISGCIYALFNLCEITL